VERIQLRRLDLVLHLIPVPPVPGCPNPPVPASREGISIPRSLILDSTDLLSRRSLVHSAERIPLPSLVLVFLDPVPGHLLGHSVERIPLWRLGPVLNPDLVPPALGRLDREEHHRLVLVLPDKLERTHRQEIDFPQASSETYLFAHRRRRRPLRAIPPLINRLLLRTAALDLSFPTMPPLEVVRLPNHRERQREEVGRGVELSTGQRGEESVWLPTYFVLLLP